MITVMLLLALSVGIFAKEDVSEDNLLGAYDEAGKTRRNLRHKI